MRIEHLDDGTKLEMAWNEALNSSVSYFRALLSSSGSSAWKLVSVLPLTASTTARDSGKSSARTASLGRITAGDVIVHRRTGKDGEVYRAVVEVDCGTDVSVDTFRGCLATPETRPIWDRMVEEAQLLDLMDTHTRVTKTNYRLGWPSSPRDVVTISKTLVDQHTLIDISTSLPRSRHEPAYLRPSPPYVRAHVSLLAWCIQLPTLDRPTDPPLPDGKARITCFWSWNPKGTWAIGGGVPQHLPSVMVGLVDYVREGSEKVPVLLGYGSDVAIGGISYDTSRVTLSVNYAIVNGGDKSEGGNQRQIEFGLSSTQTWDIQIQVKTQSGEDSPSTVWSSFVGQAPPSNRGTAAPKRLILRFAHAELQQSEELVRVNVSIEQTSPSSSLGVRINGIPVNVEPMEMAAPLRSLLEDTVSMNAMSLRTFDTAGSISSKGESSDDSVDGKKQDSGRPPAAERNIASLIKRNYIYFTSLLQEPEPKWRPVTDSRGVAIHQLDSIDKTLVVFRAEAVFVGVGVWDLYATIASPGTRLVWDKTHDDAALLEDVNELTDLWHFKSKAAWPVSARDSVLVRTTYKSPSSVHIFGFSTDSTDLFPDIPPCDDPTVIRTQIDLQGWSIEALSPNTTQVTLLEQSHPRGWSNKSSIPQVMMSTLTGLGEFAIKHGAPPVATRLGGAKAISSRFDVEQETLRFEYEPSESRRSNSSSTATAFPLPVAVRDAERTDGETENLKSLSGATVPVGNIECEIRCDADKWTSNIIVVIDPPQKAISALKRHRLSPNGSGLWLTIEHDPLLLGNERITVTVRRGTPSAGGKTTVSVNGTKIKLDVEDLSESDVQLLKKQKRSRPSRIALDQPQALGTLRKKQSNMSIQSSSPNSANPFKLAPPPSTLGRLYSPLSRLYTVAAESTKAAIVPMAAPSPAPTAGSTPVDAAVRALGQLSRIHADRDGESTDPFGWQPVSDRDGLKVEKRIVGHVSETFPVFRAGRIIEGFTAEDVSASVSTLRSNESFSKPSRLQAFGHGITTSHVIAYTAFPFRGRSALLATVVARVPEGPPPSPSVASHSPLSTIFHASSSSFDPLTLGLDSSKYNPSVMPTSNIIIEGWILETIDPYSHEQYAIPSTRCMYVAAIDYGGNMPVSVNNLLNASLPRSLLAVETALKSKGPPSRVRWPPMSVLIPDTATQGPWSLDGAEGSKVPVDQVNDGDDFTITITLQPPSPSRDGETLHPSLRHADSRVSVNSGRSTVIDLAEDIRRARRDLIVSDIDIGSELVKAGCEIAIRAVSLPEALHGSGVDSAALPLDFAGDKLGLPFKCNVISLAPSVLQSASLDPASQSRHLLRVTLPTSGYDAPVNDPLIGQTPPLPRPRWLLDLINDGAVIQIRLSPRRQQPAIYMFEGGELNVEDERKLPARQMIKDMSKSKLPQLVSRNTQDSTSLEKPLAVAREFLPNPPVIPSDTVILDTDSISVGTRTPANELADPTPETKDESSAEHRPLPTPAATRYNFWRYAPLNRFSISAPVSNEGSPIKAPVVLAPEVDGIQPAIPASPATAVVETAIRPSFLTRTAIPLPVAVVACLVCLLIGSLLRSLLSESDFVIYSPEGTLPPHGETWRELKRLGEWRIGWDRDLLIAMARRRE